MESNYNNTDVREKLQCVLCDKANVEQTHITLSFCSDPKRHGKNKNLRLFVVYTAQCFIILLPTKYALVTVSQTNINVKTRGHFTKCACLHIEFWDTGVICV